MNIAEDFKKSWNVENVLGAMDGRHIEVKKPGDSGSYFFNYKGYHSVILFAIVNAQYEFMYVHCGINGRVSDGGVLALTDFYDLLEAKQLNIPSPTKYTSNRDVILPFVFLADDAFPLKENIMKPYGHKQLTYYEKIYNYRICRGRRVVENAFGILSARFRCLQTCLQMNLESVDKIVLACCALHNLLRKKSPSYLRPSSVDWEDTETGVFTEGEWRNETIKLFGLQRKKQVPDVLAEKIRDTYKMYYNEEGSVPFQDKMVNNR